MVKFQRVTETDEDGEERLVTLEVTANEIFRTSKAQMWEARIPFAAIVNIEMSRVGSSDQVHLHCESEGTFQCSMPKRRSYVNVQEAHFFMCTFNKCFVVKLLLQLEQIYGLFLS